MKTIDEYNLETLQKAIEKNYTIKFIDHKTKRNRSYWYSIEIYNDDNLISGYGSGEITQAIQLARDHVAKTSKLE